MATETILAYAKLNARIMPLDRGDRYEDPLIEALAANGYGEVTGGGTGQSENGEISYCGIDIDLRDVEKGVPFICEFLSAHGAPAGRPSNTSTTGSGSRRRSASWRGWRSTSTGPICRTRSTRPAT